MGGFGPAVREAAQAMRPSTTVELHDDMKKLVAAVGSEARDGDIVLVKASRGTGLDEFVTGLLNLLQERS
jgi:UDP-N-acetylmuramyl pentapeptide synthase